MKDEKFLSSTKKLFNKTILSIGIPEWL